MVVSQGRTNCIKASSSPSEAEPMNIMLVPLNSLGITSSRHVHGLLFPWLQPQAEIILTWKQAIGGERIYLWLISEWEAKGILTKKPKLLPLPIFLLTLMKTAPHSLSPPLLKPRCDVGSSFVFVSLSLHLHKDDSQLKMQKLASFGRQVRYYFLKETNKKLPFQIWGNGLFSFRPFS